MLAVLDYLFEILFDYVLPIACGATIGIYVGGIILCPIGWGIGAIAMLLFKKKQTISSYNPINNQNIANVNPYVLNQNSQYQPIPQYQAKQLKIGNQATQMQVPNSMLAIQSSSIWNSMSSSPVTATPQCQPASGHAQQVQTWFSRSQSTSSSPNATVHTVYDLDGNPLQLGTHDEKASGGEGTVYTMPNEPHIMIKLYKKGTLQNASKMNEIKKRIDAMMRISACGNMKDIAWPLLPVADKQKQMIGFAMRACGGESFRSLGNVSNIKRKYPKWNRLQLAETALNFVIKVREFADNGVLINDFNPSNFLVDQNCRVFMIDCDSYQIPGPNNTTLLTHTYFDSHVAPELLKNPKLLDSPRNIHHVEFGAAVVIFGLVMCGMHPYSFSDPSKQRKVGTLGENLKNGYCAFAPGSSLKFPAAPHNEWANLWTWLPPSLQDAFVATFCDGHGNSDKRTSLKTLENALRDTVQFMRKDSRACDLMPVSPK